MWAFRELRGTAGTPSFTRCVLSPRPSFPRLVLVQDRPSQETRWHHEGRVGQSESERIWRQGGLGGEGGRFKKRRDDAQLRWGTMLSYHFWKFSGWCSGRYFFIRRKRLCFNDRCDYSKNTISDTRNKIMLILFYTEKHHTNWNPTSKFDVWQIRGRQWSHIFSVEKWDGQDKHDFHILKWIFSLSMIHIIVIIFSCSQDILVMIDRYSIYINSVISLFRFMMIDKDLKIRSETSQNIRHWLFQRIWKIKNVRFQKILLHIEKHAIY